MNPFRLENQKFPLFQQFWGRCRASRTARVLRSVRAVVDMLFWDDEME